MLFLAEFKPSAGRGFLLSRRRPKICGLAEFKPKLLLSRPEIFSKPAWGSSISVAIIDFRNFKIICEISNEEPFRWFLAILSQTELDSIVGIKVSYKIYLKYFDYFDR